MAKSLLMESSIGRFELVSHLGRGGMGDVYLAHDPERSSPIALKLIRLSVAAVDPEVLPAERRGAELQKQLQPRVPEIAAVYDFDELEGFFYIAMEYVEGVDLAEVLRERAIPVSRAVGLAIQLCRILESIQQAAGELGGQTVIHSDITPNNIRLQGDDRVRLLDFGVAKSLRMSRHFTRNVFGNSGYLAPERLLHGRLDGHSDLWAVSVVLYQMVAGYLPFRASNDDEMERRIRSGGPPEPLPPGCPTALRQVLFKALDFLPERRYPDVSVLREDLEAVRAGRKVSAPPPRSPETRRTQLPVSAGRAGSVGGQAPPRRVVVPRKHRAVWPWVAASFLALLAMAAHAYAFYEGRRIEQALAVGSTPDLPTLSGRLRRAHFFDPFTLVLSDAVKDLKASLVRQAEPVFEGFRADASLVEEDWKKALAVFKDAQELDGADDEILARLAFCEGQLALLDAKGLAERDPAAARQSWRQAADSFQKAMVFEPELVESHLALAQIYAEERSGLFDLGKLKAALGEVKRLGFEPGDRERQALAAGYFREGTDRYSRARQVAGGERIGVLYEARDDLEKAVGLCRESGERRGVGVCGEAHANLAAVLSWLQQMNQI